MSAPFGWTVVSSRGRRGWDSVGGLPFGRSHVPPRHPEADDQQQGQYRNRSPGDRLQKAEEEMFQFHGRIMGVRAGAGDITRMLVLWCGVLVTAAGAAGRLQIRSGGGPRAAGGTGGSFWMVCPLPPFHKKRERTGHPGPLGAIKNWGMSRLSPYFPLQTDGILPDAETGYRLTARIRVKLKPRARKRFSAILEELSRRHVAKLAALAGESKGTIPALRKSWRSKKIKELKDLVEEGYKPQLRQWVKDNTVRREVKFQSWIEKNDKALRVKEKLERKWSRHRHLVYVSFASNKKCLKVGRSDRGLSPIASQCFTYYFRDASRVAVYFPKRKRKKVLPALECALTHLFSPFHLYQRPARTKFREKCPACKEAHLVEKEVKKLFPA
jgi:hypothetical protein